MLSSREVDIDDDVVAMAAGPDSVLLCLAAWRECIVILHYVVDLDLIILLYSNSNIST